MDSLSSHFTSKKCWARFFFECGGEKLTDSYRNRIKISENTGFRFCEGRSSWFISLTYVTQRDIHNRKLRIQTLNVTRFSFVFLTSLRQIISLTSLKILYHSQSALFPAVPSKPDCKITIKPNPCPIEVFPVVLIFISLLEHCVAENQIDMFSRDYSNASQHQILFKAFSACARISKSVLSDSHVHL